MSNILFSIDEDTKLKVYEMFGRTKEQVDDDIRTLTEWFKTQPHLPELMAEAKIRNFLILNKFSIEKTKQKIDMYYTIRSLICNWFDESNPKLPNMKRFMQASLWAMHPTLFDGLYRVYFFKLKVPGKFDLRDCSLQLFNTFEMRLQEDYMVGDIFVLDYGNFTLEDFTRLTLATVANHFETYRKVYSLRLRAAYMINCPSAISIALKMIKMVIKPKIFDRLLAYKDDAILKEIFSEDVLPKDYGGTGLSLEELEGMLFSKFEEYQERFDKLDELRVNENLRPEGLQNTDHLGFYGNFKKLNVD